MGATNSTQSEVILQTSKGSLRGLQFSDARTDKPAYSRYSRIPYALPPLGPLRWQKPQALPENFSFNGEHDESGDYTSFGPICPQPVYDLVSGRIETPEAGPEQENVQSEDCLYLNIWVPAGRDGERPEGGWPVQFYIHGGWLQIGDAMQNNVNDPFDLLLTTSHPRIIISPTYRLNIFGFLCCPPDSDTSSPSSFTPLCPGNFGLWDQRLALEWTHQNISLFSGNPHNITLGGLSAGAHSAMFQLHHDTYSTRPNTAPLIRRAYFWSNIVGFQPNPPTSPAIRSQFDELTTHLHIPPNAPLSDKISALRALPPHTLLSTLPHLTHHTFRAVTDHAFIPSTFLSSIYDPHGADFSPRLKAHGVQLLLGEVAHEAGLYRLVNPPATPDRQSLRMQLLNYYPAVVVEMLMRTYSLPGDDEEQRDGGGEEEEEDEIENWKSTYGTIVADTQVHAPLRGFVHALLNFPLPTNNNTPTTPISGLTISSIHRYHISHLPPTLSTSGHLPSSMGVCHSADASLWWLSGVRAGFTERERQRVEAFLEPFGKFVGGGSDGGGGGGGVGFDGGVSGGWGTKGEREVRQFMADEDEDAAAATREEGDGEGEVHGHGVTRIRLDEGWEDGMERWGRLWEVQREHRTSY